jgi:hypothetical protein
MLVHVSDQILSLYMQRRPVLKRIKRYQKKTRKIGTYYQSSHATIMVTIPFQCCTLTMP